MKYLAIIFLLFITTNLFSQANTIPPADIPRIKQQAKDYIFEFARYMQKLGSDAGLTPEARTAIGDNLISLFDEDATIQVLNLRKNKNTYAIAPYIKNVVALYTKRFKFVIFKFKSITYDFNNLTPVKNSNGEITAYKFTYTFVQDFCVTNQDTDSETWDPKKLESYDVCEETTKTGEIIIKKRVSPTIGARWVVLLGSIQVNKIDDLKD